MYLLIFAYSVLVQFYFSFSFYLSKRNSESKLLWWKIYKIKTILQFFVFPPIWSMFSTYIRKKQNGKKLGKNILLLKFDVKKKHIWKNNIDKYCCECELFENDTLSAEIFEWKFLVNRSQFIMSFKGLLLIKMQSAFTRY